MGSNDEPRRYSVQCPAESCGEQFEVPQERLGRNTYCPLCGIRLTARPVEVAGRLVRRQREARGQAGQPLPRLPLAVLVDNVRSLWNVGSIFRTADACGFERVVLTGITGHPPDPRIAKTALGAEDAVGWSYRADPLEALAELTGVGYTPIAVESKGGAASLEDLRWPPRACLVVGNEVSGLTPQVLEACPVQVAIPMLGIKESLNVAVAFGIVAYRASQALGAADGRGPSLEHVG